MTMIPSIPGASLFATLRGASTFAPLRNRGFAILWTASLASNLGSLIQSVGASWLMTSLTPSAYMVALVQTATSLPILLFSLLAGAVADVLDRRQVMLASQFAMLGTSVLLAVLAFAGAMGPWTLLFLTFLLGMSAALYGPAWQAAVGEVVERSEVPAAVGLNSLGYNLARAVGPAIGGAIVAAAGAAAAFLVNALSYIGLIAALLRWRPPRPEHHLPPEHVFPAVVAGLRYAAQSPRIRTVLLRSLLFGTFGSAIWALLPVVAARVIVGGPLTYGILLGALGTGAIIGAMGSSPLRRRFSNEQLVQGATAAFALATAANGLVGHIVPASAVLVAAGAAWVVGLSTFNVTVQMSVPRWVTGRSIAVYQMAVFGGMAGGSWLWGWSADHIGPGATLVVCGGGMLASLAVGLWQPLKAYEKLDLEPTGTWPDPTLIQDVSADTGPVRIIHEYRIADDKVPAFLDAMRDMRRMRRRDGAAEWTLYQDIGQPDLWIESYKLATWGDHLRGHYRMTQSDRALMAKAFALHTGPGQPKMRRLLDRETMMVGAARVERALKRAAR